MYSDTYFKSRNHDVVPPKTRKIDVFDVCAIFDVICFFLTPSPIHPVVSERIENPKHNKLPDDEFQVQLRKPISINLEYFKKLGKASPKIIHVSIGKRHIGFIDNKNNVYVMGQNNKGQLGLQDKIERYSPTIVLEDRIVRFLDCGEENTIACIEERSNWGELMEVYLYGTGQYIDGSLPGFFINRQAASLSTQFTKLNLPEIPRNLKSIHNLKGQLFLLSYYTMPDKNIFCNYKLNYKLNFIKKLMNKNLATAKELLYLIENKRSDKATQWDCICRILKECIEVNAVQPKKNYVHSNSHSSRSSKRKNNFHQERQENEVQQKLDILARAFEAYGYTSKPHYQNHILPNSHYEIMNINNDYEGPQNFLSPQISHEASPSSQSSSNALEKELSFMNPPSNCGDRTFFEALFNNNQYQRNISKRERRKVVSNLGILLDNTSELGVGFW